MNLELSLPERVAQAKQQRFNEIHREQTELQVDVLRILEKLGDAALDNVIVGPWRDISHTETA